MVLLVPQDIVVTARERRNHTQVNTKAGAVNHGVFLALIVGQLALELLVQVKGAVEEWGTGTACAILLGGFNCCLLDALVIDKSGVTVGTEHQDSFAIHDDLGVLLAGNSAKVGIDARGLGLLRFIISS